MGFPAETSDGEKIIIVETGMAGDQPIYRTEDGRRFANDTLSGGGQHKLRCIDEPVAEVYSEQPLEEVTKTEIGYDAFTLTLEDGTVIDIEAEDELAELEPDGGEVIELDFKDDDPELDDAA